MVVNDQNTITPQMGTGNPSPAAISVKELNLMSPDTLKLFQRYIEFLTRRGEPHDGYVLLRSLEKLVSNDPEFTAHPSAYSQGYFEILDQARAFVLPMLTPDEITEYFRKGVLTGMRNKNIDLLGNISAKMVQFITVEERDDFKAKLRSLLRQNQQRLTLHGIRSSTGIVAPTVSQWLHMVEETADEGRPLSLAVQDNKDFQQLSKEEQDQVLDLMALDDLLSLSSDTPEGYESAITVVDEKGNRTVIEYGESRPAVDEDSLRLYREATMQAPSEEATGTVTSSQPTKDKVASYRATMKAVNDPHQAEDAKRYAAQEEMLKSIGTDIDQVVSHLANGLITNNSDTVIVSLSVLARSGAFVTAIRNAQLRKAYVDEFIVKLPSAASVQPGIIQNAIESHPDDPVLTAGFLRWALGRVLPNNEAESARIGNQIGNLLSALSMPEFINMTYFDVPSGGYRWTPITTKPDGTLEWVA